MLCLNYIVYRFDGLCFVRFFIGKVLLDVLESLITIVGCLESKAGGGNHSCIIKHSGVNSTVFNDADTIGRKVK